MCLGFNIGVKFWGASGYQSDRGMEIPFMYNTIELPFCIVLVQFILLIVLFIYSSHCVQAPS